MTARRSETLTGKRREREGRGSKMTKKSISYKSLLLRNEMFVHVFLYHFEKGKSLTCRQLRSILTISHLGYLRNPKTTQLHKTAKTSSHRLRLKLLFPSLLFNLTCASLLAPKRRVVAQTLQIVLMSTLLCCIKSFHCY